MKLIYLVVFVVFVSYFDGTSGKESVTDENIEQSTLKGRNDRISEHNDLEDLKNNANKNKSCDCGKNTNCSIINGKKKCTCIDGYSMYEGNCMKCDCGGKWERCSFSKGIYQKRTCTCGRGYAVERCTGLFCNDTCTKCDCGSNGNCSFGTNGKNCSCDKGFAANNGKCVACECGRGGTCSFKEGKKICECPRGFAESYGMCIACDCGYSYKSCSFDSVVGTRKCVCGIGYAAKRSNVWPYHQTCYACDCGTNGTCEFNYYGKAVCKCQQGFKEVNGKCQESCDCGQYGKCKIINGVKTCTCYSGYSEYRGICRACQCGYGRCSFTIYGSKKCDCYAGSIYDTYEDRCVACDCGINSKGCSFDVLGRRTCSCEDGFVANKDITGNEHCKECDCGKDGNCTMSFGVKKCICSEGFKEVNGKCLECDCGTQTVSCNLDDFKFKNCTCKDGYYAHRTFTMSNDQCLPCRCGFYSTGCYFKKQNEKICKCQYGALKVDSFRSCKECECGTGSKSCFFTLTGKRQCTCYSGYRIDNDYTNGDSCVKDVSSYGKSHGWKIATYVVSVLIVVIIIGMLIVIADRRSFQRRMDTHQR